MNILKDTSLYKQEFPRFELPKGVIIPKGFKDISWHNDICPSFSNVDKNLVLYIDYDDLDEREEPDGKQFTLLFDSLDEDGCHHGHEKDEEQYYHTDSWDQVLELIILKNSNENKYNN
ncbi:MAG: hypothetical protein HN982_00140 [Candidatus Marinimicrobia bacterium]|nr:hypothetical protein [Candidatus Neomarinimicrobiota bacterium]